MSTVTRVTGTYHKPFSLQHTIMRTLGILLLVVSLFVFMFPFFWMISCSLKTLAEVSVFPPPVLPAVPQWQNYITAFTRAPLARYGLNSVIVSLSVIVLVVSLTSAAAYALVFLNFRFKRVIFLMLMAPQMVAGVTLMLPLFIVLRQLHMLNTLPALIIPYTVMYSPFSTMLLRGYLQTLPKDLVEAARVDGASELWTLTRVIFPLLKPALGTVAIFCFIWSWNEFLYALVYVQKPMLRTISVGLALLQSVPNFPPQTQIILAAATAITLPVLIVFGAMQRQFIEGITAGAVKA
jgi:ABC-type glycerol-3-phosphate transport system permease component